MPPEIREALTFDDVLLVPRYSEVMPAQVETATWLTRGIEMNIPLLSAAMDTVTEADTAIAMARQGGIGIVHKNMTPEQQGREVRRVKRSESGMVVDPLTITSGASLREALELMRRHGFSGLPVVDAKGAKPLGILTSRDVRFETNLDQKVGDVMTRDPITVPMGVAPEEAKKILHKHRIEKLLVVGKDEGASRPHHGEGHHEVRLLPARAQRQRWSPARRSGGEHRSRLDGARPGSRRQRGRRGGGGYRSRSLSLRDRGRSGHPLCVS